MPQLSSDKLSELSYPEAEQALSRGDVFALLPTGATEAHGPHLPLSTDVIISENGALRAVELLRGEDLAALVLPPIAYSVTEFASDFCGTVSIPVAAAQAYVREVILGAVRTGFRGVVICNAHLEPGNIQALHGAVADARAAGAAVVFPDVTRKPHALRLGEEFRSGACHAGSYETSLVLAADPFIVRSDLAKRLPANPISLSRAIRDGKNSFVEAGGPDAYFGDPAAASAAEGDALYRELADIFAGGVRELLDQKTPGKETPGKETPGKE
ncbi:MAG: creatininase family protein [Myxococcota bacterium]